MPQTVDIVISHAHAGKVSLQLTKQNMKLI